VPGRYATADLVTDEERAMLCELRGIDKDLILPQTCRHCTRTLSTIYDVPVHNKQHSHADSSQSTFSKRKWKPSYGKVRVKEILIDNLDNLCRYVAKKQSTKLCGIYSLL
jgi:hypothetical protein